MSETMTASERARELIEELMVASYAEGGARKMLRLALDDGTRSALRGRAESHNTDKRNANAALLAYVARLEAVAQAARALANDPLPDAWEARDKWSALFNTLAALDRPEDGEHE